MAGSDLRKRNPTSKPANNKDEPVTNGHERKSATDNGKSTSLIVILSVMVVITWGIAATAYFEIVDYKSIFAKESPQDDAKVDTGDLHTAQEETDEKLPDTPEVKTEITDKDTQTTPEKKETDSIKDKVETKEESKDKSKKVKAESPPATKSTEDKKESADKTAKSGKKRTQVTAADKPILVELKNGERMIKRNQANEAVTHFDRLVSSHPDSPRARFGKANAHVLKAEKDRSNDGLKKAIEMFKETAQLPNAPSDLKREALLKAANKYVFLGMFRDSIRVFNDLVRTYPDSVEVLNDFGVNLLMIGKNDRAKKVYERVLSLEPDNGFALVHLGFIVKTANDWEASIDYLRRGIESNEPGTQQGKFFFHLGDALFRTGREDEAQQIYQLGADRGLFKSKYQRSLYNVDRLKSRPFWTAEQANAVDSVKKLEANWKVIRDEALKVMDVDKGLFLHEEESLKNTGEWRQFTLFARGQKHNDCSRTPKTCSLISKMTNSAGCKRGQVKYSIMMPGTHVWPHTGPTNCRIRMHLGLVIPKTGKGARIRCADEIRTWEEGKVLIFDDSFEHEVWQDAESYRLILIVDIWHPDLTDREKRTLSAI